MQQAEVVDSKEKLKDLEAAANEGFAVRSLIWACVMNRANG